MAAQPEEVRAAVSTIAERWRGERAERQARRHLDPVDFAALREAGFLSLVVPVELGGPWVDVPTSARVVCETLRVMAGGDPAVALVSAMHPAVVAFWLCSPDASQPAVGSTARRRLRQRRGRRAVGHDHVGAGQRRRHRQDPGGRRARLDGRPVPPGRAVPRSPATSTSAAGRASPIGMITTALPEGEDEPTIFVLDVRDRPWDGSAGMQLARRVGRHGHGRDPEPRHAARRRARRSGWRGTGRSRPSRSAPGRSSRRLFTAVVLGVLDEAVATGPLRSSRGKADELRAYEQVEWSRAEQDHWLAVQAYEGALRAIEARRPGVAAARRAAGQAAVRRARRAGAAAAHPGARRRHVLAPLAVRALVRGRARARVPAAAVGPGLRHAVRHVVSVTSPGQQTASGRRRPGCRRARRTGRRGPSARRGCRPRRPGRRRARR